MSVTQSRRDLVFLLREQIQFLEASAHAYDSGFEGEAKRLAVVLRVLLHDTKSSHSLVGTLGIKDALKFWDVVGAPPDDAIAFVGLSMGFGEQGIRYFPKLGEPTRRLSFGDWWSALILIQRVTGVQFSRGEAILSLAETDGGAHVDPALGQSYAELSRSNSFGWEVWRGAGKGVVENSPALPIVRQAAHEVLGTLREQLRTLVPEWE